MLLKETRLESGSDVFMKKSMPLFRSSTTKLLSTYYRAPYILRSIF